MMSATSEEIAGQIVEKVREIEDEIRRLEAAKAALLGSAPERTEDPRLTRMKQSHARRRRTSRGKTSPGAFQDRVARLVEENPGVSTAEIRRHLRTVGGPQVYATVRRLAETGRITGSHEAWRLSGDADGEKGSK